MAQKNLSESQRESEEDGLNELQQLNFRAPKWAVLAYRRLATRESMTVPQWIEFTLNAAVLSEREKLAESFAAVVEQAEKEQREIERQLEVEEKLRAEKARGADWNEVTKRAGRRRRVRTGT